MYSGCSRKGYKKGRKRESIRRRLTLLRGLGAPVDKLFRDGVEMSSTQPLDMYQILTWVPSLTNCRGTSANSFIASDILSGELCCAMARQTSLTRKDRVAILTRCPGRR